MVEKNVQIYENIVFLMLKLCLFLSFKCALEECNCYSMPYEQRV